MARFCASVQTLEDGRGSPFKLQTQLPCLTFNEYRVVLSCYFAIAEEKGARRPASGLLHQCSWGLTRSGSLTRQPPKLRAVERQAGRPPVEPRRGVAISRSRLEYDLAIVSGSLHDCMSTVHSRKGLEDERSTFALSGDAGE